MPSDYGTLVEATRKAGCVTMASPFDEASVDLCQELGVQIIKIASSDLNDWMLIEKIATARKPVIVSTGGSSLKDMDDLVTFFENRNIPLAINHCVSLYPSENADLQLNQIDFLTRRYPNHTIGFSTHEYQDWTGRSRSPTRRVRGRLNARRHRGRRHHGLAILLAAGQIDTWFKAWKDAKEMCGPSGRDLEGQLARRDRVPGRARAWCLCGARPAGRPALRDEDVYLAIPLQKGQISCRELMRGEVVMRDMRADEPIRIDDIDSPYANNDELKRVVLGRGL